MKHLILLFALLPATLFAQIKVPDQEIQIIETEENSDERYTAVVNKNYTINDGYLFLKYSMNDPGKPNIGCSGGSTSYSLQLKYPEIQSEIVLTNADFVFNYSYSGGMMFIESREVEVINLNVQKIDNKVTFKGIVKYISTDALDETSQRTLNIDLTMDVHTPIVDKHYSFQSTASVVQGGSLIEEPLMFPEVMAEFPGGNKEYFTYLQDNLKYPPVCAEMEIQGKVFLSFVVMKDGSITDIELLRGIQKEMDREAIRLVKQMPKWKPAMDRGRAVNSIVRIPVVFILK